MKHILILDFIISDKWWLIDIGSGVVLVEFIFLSLYLMFIVEINPASIENWLNKLYSNEEIVVFPLVPVIPIKSILDDGLS